MLTRRLGHVLWTLLGLGLAAMALFAPQLGLDADSEWGPSRKLLLVAGGLSVLVGWRRELWSLVTEAGKAIRTLAARGIQGSGLGMAYRRLIGAWEGMGLFRAVRVLRLSWQDAWMALLARSRVLRALLGTRAARVSLATWAAFSVVALSYLWFASVGTWSRWPGTSAYQDLQAEAFLHGQAHLLRDPEPRLLALEDPYDPAARSSVRHLWDASLFEGRYYLYWGPVPALLLVPVKAVAGVRVGDNVLVFLFSVGSLYWMARLLLRVWEDHLLQVPGWAVVASVLVAGWANPAPWMLNSPWVYEAAIVGGQMFLLMGIYALYPFVVLSAPGPARLLWAGVAFSLAVGTRLSLAAAVGAASTLVFLRAYERWRLGDLGKAKPGLAAFVLSLVLGAAALAGYNQVRFGSPFDFGHRYQLTSLNLQEVGSQATTLRNMPPNLYNYLVNPARTLPVFPYIKPRWGGKFMSYFRIPVPEDYYSRQITGMLLAAPFCLYGLSSVSRLWQRMKRIDAGRANAKREAVPSDSVLWIEAMLTGVALASFIVVQLYVVASMRYQGDFMPAVMCLASIGFWRGLMVRMQSGKTSTGYSLVGLVAMIWTILAGLLLGITSYHARFEVHNPALFKLLTDWFTW